MQLRLGQGGSMVAFMGNIERMERGDHPFRGHPVFGIKAGLAGGLARQELERAIAGARAVEPGMNPERPDLIARRLMMCEREITRASRGRESELAELARKAVAEIYGITGDGLAVLGEGRIMDRPEPPTAIPPRPTGPGAAPWEIIDRRITHNALIQGAGILHMAQALALVRDELEGISLGLYRNCLLFSNLAQVFQFPMPTPSREQPHEAVLGEEAVSWGEEGPVISAKATVFPVLLQEFSKGVMELLFAPGLPRPGELTEEELDAFAWEAEHPSDECWHFMWGPSLAARLQSAMEAHALWLKFPDGKTILDDMKYTYSVMSLVPSMALHRHLPGLVRTGEAAPAAAAEFRKALLAAEQSWQGGE